MKRLSRVGETVITNQGYKLSIVKYYNSNNCELIFEDGTILYNKTYNQFKSKTLRKPIDYIGKRFKMNDGYEVEITEYKNVKNLVVRYDDGITISNRGLSCVLKGSIMKPKGRIGEVIKNNKGFTMTIVEYHSATSITVEFGENQKVFGVTYTAFKKGSVDNPYEKSVCGVGYIGVGNYSSRENNKISKKYSVWAGMIERGHNIKLKEKQPTYKDVTVCKEWHNFQNFAQWFDENWKPYMQDWQLDKDILCPTCKIYSPETCCFVPAEINSLFVKSNATRGEYPIGVHFDREKLKFVAQLRINKGQAFKGYYKTSEEAFEVYKTAKESQIKEIADKWKGQITEQVYQAMYNYKIKITD